MDIKDISRFGQAAQQQILRKLVEQKEQNGVLPRKSSRSETQSAGGVKSPPAKSKAVYTSPNARESKYHAKPTARIMPNGTVRVFDSKKEAERYDELRFLLAIGEIRNLKIQPQFTLIEGYVTADGEAVRPERYTADFSYECKVGDEWQEVVEDVKGKIKTETYRVKRKQMIAKFGVSVREV